MAGWGSPNTSYPIIQNNGNRFGLQFFASATDKNNRSPAVEGKKPLS
jgi:hypothetical protein